MAPIHGGDPVGSILGPMGSHWGQKMGQNRKKLLCPKIRIFRLPRGHRFRPKLDLKVMAPIHGGDTLGSILGPMGSHWGKKWVKTIKNYHAPKFEFSTTPRSSISAKILPYDYGAKSRWGPPRVHLGANGVPLGQKMGPNCKKLPCPKIRTFDYPQSSILAKIWPHACGPKWRWGPPRVHLGAYGVPLGPKNGSKPKKITMPQNSNFRQSSISAKIGPYGYGIKSRWGPPRVHIGAIGTKKLVKTVKNYHAPKFEFSTTPRSSIWAKIGLYGYGVKSRWGPPRVHLRANGVPLGPKNGSKS